MKETSVCKLSKLNGKSSIKTGSVGFYLLVTILVLSICSDRFSIVFISSNSEGLKMLAYMMCCALAGFLIV